MEIEPAKPMDIPEFNGRQMNNNLKSQPDNIIFNDENFWTSSTL